MRTLIRNGTIVTMNKKREVALKTDLLIEDEKIKSIGKGIKAKADQIIDAEENFVIPGLIQTHTHLCQALFRGYADDLDLLDWLKEKIWPMEHAHTAQSLRASAEIGLLEMQLMGTTSILDMGTVRWTHELFETVIRSGMRYFGGKCLMDIKGSSGPLYEDRKSAMKETEALIKSWHKKTDLIEYAIAPRFAVSCSNELMQECADMQKKYDILMHTHASESLEEVALIKKRSGLLNIDFLDKMGLINSKAVIAHGVHLSSGELKKMVKKKAGLTHCPSSNLKLASGVAHIEKYRKAGLKMGIGSDGAPCNNTMDPFLEMRLAALLQKPIFGPEAFEAKYAFELGTIGGAEVLGRSKDIGSLEVGKFADVVIVDRSHPSVATVKNPYSALVYSCSGRDVTDVWINGKSIVRASVHQIYDPQKVIKQAKSQLKILLKAI